MDLRPPRGAQSTNAVEPAPCPAVVWRKRSSGCASDCGFRIAQPPLTAVTALGMRDRNVVARLTGALTARRLGLPVPVSSPVSERLRGSYATENLRTVEISQARRRTSLTDVSKNYSNRVRTMRLTGMLAVLAVSLATGEHTPELPLSNTRLSVHTLVREDIFAGILDGDMSRLARGEKNIEILLRQRPAEKAALLVWKAGALLHRGLLALEANRRAEFDERYAQATDLLAEAKKLGPQDQGVDAASGGIYVLMADRLPENLRATAWAKAYQSYRSLWEKQAAVVGKLPLHLRGELLGGLAQSAQRTGRTKELAGFLDELVAVAPHTAYARTAKRWKEDPNAALGTPLTCLSCHGPGRFQARRIALERESSAATNVNERPRP